MTKKTEDYSKDNKNLKERKLFVPGETAVKGEEYLPGDFTRKEDDEIVVNRYGLVEIVGRVVRVIPISGVFEPRRGNTVIGRVENITFAGWVIDIGGPYTSFLPITECPRFIDKNNLSEFADVGDVLTLKIVGVKKGGVDLTLKSKGLGKLEGGRIIKINSHKVPRVIGKEGSMINLIKSRTKTEIIVGQNGFIWLKGDIDNEKKAEEAIKMVAEESSSIGLTEKIEKFLSK